MDQQADPHDPIVILESNASESGGRASSSHRHHSRAGSDRESISRASVPQSSRREKLGDEFNSNISDGDLKLKNQTESVRKEQESIERYEEEQRLRKEEETKIFTIVDKMN